MVALGPLSGILLGMRRTWDDNAQLMAQLNRLKQLIEELNHVQQDPALREDISERIGRELDSARKALRPYLQK
jgi:hypothetical protein